MIKINKLKEIVLILISIILIIFIVKLLNIFKICGLLFRVLTPVFVGFIYAWLLNPLINILSKNHKRNFICIFIFLGIILLVSLFFYYLIPIVYKEINELVDLLPSFSNLLNEKFNQFKLAGSLDKLYDFLNNNVPLYLVNGIKGLIKYLGVIVVGLILGLYMSMEYDKMILLIEKVVPKKHRCVFINLTQEISSNVRKCVNGTLFVAFMVFVGDTICFSLLKLDAPMLLGLLCGITDLIPYVGPYIGGVVAVIVGFTESRMLGFLTIIVCVLVQSIENYVLQPFVMSKSIKISPIFIIIGLLIFGNLFGIVGMIMATPIVAVLKVFSEHISEILEKCKDKKEIKRT